MLTMAPKTNERRDRRIQAGEWLREQRDAREMSQKRFADLIGVSDASVSSYERGVSSPDDNTTENIARVFGLSIVECRRHLGLYVPPDAKEVPPPPAASVFEAILADPDLLRDEKEHLLRQVTLLKRPHRGALTEREKAAIAKDVDLAEKAVRALSQDGDVTDTPKRRR